MPSSCNSLIFQTDKPNELPDGLRFVISEQTVVSFVFLPPSEDPAPFCYHLPKAIRFNLELFIFLQSILSVSSHDTLCLCLGRAAYIWKVLLHDSTEVYIYFSATPNVQDDPERRILPQKFTVLRQKISHLGNNANSRSSSSLEIKRTRDFILLPGTDSYSSKSTNFMRCNEETKAE